MTSLNDASSVAGTGSILVRPNYPSFASGTAACMLTAAEGDHVIGGVPTRVTLPADTIHWMNLSSLRPAKTATAPGVPFPMTADLPSLGFAAGAMVLTSRGEMRVETLKKGDLLVGMRSGKMVPVRSLRRHGIDLRSHPEPDSINPVRICADAFGAGRPHRDLVLSPHHALHVDGHLIAVRHLLNGASIRQEQWDSVCYHQVELEAHDVLLADGLMAESFLDHQDGLEAAADEAEVRKEEACAPKLPGGEALRMLRQTLLDQAADLGYARTEESDIQLWIGNRRIQPRKIPGGVEFHLPKGTSRVRITSHRFVPSQMRASPFDGRRLGVGIVAIQLDNRDLALDDARLGEGWHAPEPGLRWTKGEAWLRASSARTISFTLFEGAFYWTHTERLVAVGSDTRFTPHIVGGWDGEAAALKPASRAPSARRKEPASARR